MSDDYIVKDGMSSTHDPEMVTVAFEVEPGNYFEVTIPTSWRIVEERESHVMNLIVDMARRKYREEVGGEPPQATIYWPIT